jgi:hypothetical protein
VLARLGWLPVFALVLLVFRAAFGAYERRGGGSSTVVRSGAPARTPEARRV